MTEEKRQRLYEMRMKRLQDLIKLQAPQTVIARECLLVASVVVSQNANMTVAGLIPYILTEFSNNTAEGS